MVLNKNFSKSTTYTQLEIESFLKINQLEIPPDFKYFLNIIGGETFLEDETYEYYVDISDYGEAFPFVEFFTLNEELLKRINNLNDEEYEGVLGKNDYLPIGYGDGQNRILMGKNNQNLNKIYILNDEEVIVTFLCDSLEEFINQYVKLENEIEGHLD